MNQPTMQRANGWTHLPREQDQHRSRPRIRVRALPTVPGTGGADCRARSRRRGTARSRAGRDRPRPAGHYRHWSSRPFGCSPSAGARDGSCALHHLGGTGWTNCRMPISACLWSWPTSGAGRVLCPTDVVVTWNGSPDLTGLQIEVAPQFAPAIKSQFGDGIVTFSPPWLFRTPPGWDLYSRARATAGNPTASPGRRDRDLVAQLHFHPELEAGRTGDCLFRPR